MQAPFETTPMVNYYTLRFSMVNSAKVPPPLASSIIRAAAITSSQCSREAARVWWNFFLDFLFEMQPSRSSSAFHPRFQYPRRYGSRSRSGQTFAIHCAHTSEGRTTTRAASTPYSGALVPLIIGVHLECAKCGNGEFVCYSEQKKMKNCAFLQNKSMGFACKQPKRKIPF